MTTFDDGHLIVEGGHHISLALDRFEEIFKVSLNHCRVSDPAEIEALHTLQWLKLDNCQFDKRLIIGRLAKHLLLEIHGDVRGVDWQSARNIESFRVFGANLEGVGPIRLRSLQLENLTVDLKEFLSGARSFPRVNAERCLIRSHSMAEGRCSSLSLRKCEVESWEFLVGLKGLRYLHVLHQDAPPLSVLDQLPSLRVFHVSGGKYANHEIERLFSLGINVVVGKRFSVTGT